MTEKTFESFFKNIQAPRYHNKRHKLIDIIFIAICALVAGADTYEQIENSVLLDIAFQEDESRVRKGNSPENFAAIRHIALNLLRNNKTFKGSIKTKRLNAAKTGGIGISEYLYVLALHYNDSYIDNFKGLV